MGKVNTAFTWARFIAGQSALPFGGLAKGEQFRFPHSMEILTKCSIGRYTDSRGNKWSTGQNTAVLPIGE
jgi:hypothetical protein